MADAKHKLPDGTLVSEDDFPYGYTAGAQEIIARTGGAPTYGAVPPAAGFNPTSGPGFPAGDLATALTRAYGATVPANAPPPRPAPWAGGVAEPEAVAKAGTSFPMVAPGVPGMPQNHPQAAALKRSLGHDWATAEPLIAGTESNDKNVPNYRYDKTHTASGHYQITDTNWRAYGPRAGIDVSKYPNAMSVPKEEQAKVAQLMFNEQGYAPWAPYNPKLAAMIGWGGGGRTGGRFGGMGPGRAMAGTPGGEAAAPDLAVPQSGLSRAMGDVPGAQAAPQTVQLGAAAEPAAPAGAPARRPMALPTVQAAQAPDLRAGYLDALASVLTGKRRGLGSIFG